ncbi:MAG: endonuclease domain-containing protein [Phenylobacterium sp.]|nr:endonuclease domain-containing protein [Phenylobacterium sp.]
MTRNSTVAQARALRRRATSTERFLWRLLRDRRLEGLKFRRQTPLGPYVLDFVCLRHRLVVEADGPFHDAVRDAARDKWLAAQGFRVLRFANRDITNRDWSVIDSIRRAVLADPGHLMKR